MPAGDAQRVWFPEMTEELMHFWTGQAQWCDVIAFCDRMFALRKAALISDAQMKELDRDWSRYRKAHALDAYGHKTEASSLRIVFQPSAGGTIGSLL
ncbi:MAG: hypothetical protein WCR06_09490 [bacterium]